MEPRKEDIEKNAKSMAALYVQGGSDVLKFIQSVAEMQTYYQEVIKSQTETIGNFVRAAKSGRRR